MNVNVYLKRSTGTTSPLVGQTSIDGTNVRFGLGINAPVAKWDRKRQRVRTGRDARLVDINAAIEREVQRVTQAFRKLVADYGRTPRPDEFKTAIQRVKAGKQIGRLTFNAFVDDYIERAKTMTNAKGEQINERTLAKYRTIREQVSRFAAQTFHRAMTFEDWSETTLAKYVHFRASQGVGINTIGKDVATIKLWLKRSFSAGMHNNRSFMEPFFVPKKKQTRRVHLTVEDLARFETFDFGRANMLSNVRDLFLVACWTGFRISDLRRFPIVMAEAWTTAGNRCPESVTFVQSKTGETVAVTLLDPVRRIVEKHNGRLPRVYADPVMNRELKVALDRAGINYTVEIQSTDVFDPKPKRVRICDVVTMHTARRSFATNLWNDGGVSARELMTLTGHTSEGALLAYLNLSREETAKATATRLLGRF